jgi:hypothetical protein
MIWPDVPKCQREIGRFGPIWDDPRFGDRPKA